MELLSRDNTQALKGVAAIGIPQVLFITLIIAAVTFLVSILGVVLGRHKIPIPERTASIVAGMVLIVLGIVSLVCN